MIILQQKITSKDNKMIKTIYKLIGDSKYRAELNQAVLFGEHLIIEAIKYNKLITVIVVESSLVKYDFIIQSVANYVLVLVVTDEIINKLNPLNSNIDILGIIKIDQPVINSDIYKTDGIYLDSIQDPGNLGTMLRIAKATGINNIFLSHNSVDCYNYKVLRASQGVQLGLNIFENYSFDNIINNYHGKIIATSPRANQTIYQIDYTKIAIMWVFGNEGRGISSDILAKIVDQVKIPINMEVESLNIAIAMTICVFECMRQRL